MRDGEQDGADDRDDEQAGAGAPRPDPVERPADRELREGEGREPDRGQRAEIGGAQAEVAVEVRRDDGEEGAVELAEDVGEEEDEEGRSRRAPGGSSGRAPSGARGAFNEGR